MEEIMTDKNDEISAVERRIAENAPEEAQPARELRALVADVATSERPESLAELRRLIDAKQISAERRGLLQYVLMDMLDKRELEISPERNLIVHGG